VSSLLVDKGSQVRYYFRHRDAGCGVCASGEPNLIVICLAGGLGNQLFQYSFGRFLAHKHGAELWLDTSHYAPDNPTSIRVGYSKDNPNSIKAFELENFEIYCQRILGKDDVNELRNSFKSIFDHGQIPDDIVALGDNSILIGEWSSHLDYLFTGEFPNLLRNELRLSYPLDEPGFEHVRHSIDGRLNSVAVQVRRGDYKHLQHMFALLGEEYYENAFCVMEDKVASPKYFVFSDEIEWVEANFRFSSYVEFVKTSTVKANFELSRRCKHVIGANSTYSWWTAYLIDNPGKVIVMPAHYYGNEQWQAEYEKEPVNRYMPTIKV
jgi:Glycosyl transferase family 11